MCELHCILCGSDLLENLETFEVERVIFAWKSNYDIDVTREFDGLGSFSEIQCKGCGLGFFAPVIAGSSALYENLKRYHWYYMADKWEFKQALADLQPAEPVLEVGSGSGDFIAQALEKGVEIEGIELSEAAVKAAAQRDLPVRTIDLSDLAAVSPGKYDAVCAFQVLEHVPNPRKFLESCTELLRVGGVLLLSVPDSNGFIQHDPDDWLNRPPHHASLWSKEVLQALPRMLPLRMRRLRYEPLASYHADWYSSVQQNRLPGDRVTGRFLRWWIDTAFRKIIQPAGTYRWMHGHTMYASFQKIAD